MINITILVVGRGLWVVSCGSWVVGSWGFQTYPYYAMYILVHVCRAGLDYLVNSSEMCFQGHIERRESHLSSPLHMNTGGSGVRPLYEYPSPTATIVPIQVFGLWFGF